MSKYKCIFTPQISFRRHHPISNRALHLSAPGTVAADPVRNWRLGPALRDLQSSPLGPYGDARTASPTRATPRESNFPPGNNCVKSRNPSPQGLRAGSATKHRLLWKGASDISSIVELGLPKSKIYALKHILDPKVVTRKSILHYEPPSTNRGLQSSPRN